MTRQIELDVQLVTDLRKLGRDRVVASVMGAEPGRSMTVRNTQQQADLMKATLSGIVDAVVRQTDPNILLARHWFDRIEALLADGLRVCQDEHEQLAELLGGLAGAGDHE